MNPNENREVNVSELKCPYCGKRQYFYNKMCYEISVKECEYCTRRFLYKKDKAWLIDDTYDAK
jgi:hypothetical protein